MMLKYPGLRLDEGGTIRIGNTRVTLDTVLTAYRAHDLSPEEIQHQYPTTELADIYEAIAYSLRFPGETNKYLHDRWQASLADVERQFHLHTGGASGQNND